MKKRLLTFLLIAHLIFTVSATAFATDAVTAKPTSSTVLVNGENVAFDAYNIDGYNYFKLRDLAYKLSGTEKQFEVAFDISANAILLTRGKTYTEAGGEMASKGNGNKSASPTTSQLYLDGGKVSFTAYNIDNNNYFKLRDIGAALNFGVDWDGTKNTVAIDTSKGYTAETPTPPAETRPNPFSETYPGLFPTTLPYDHPHITKSNPGYDHDAWNQHMYELNEFKDIDWVKGQLCDYSENLGYNVQVQKHQDEPLQSRYFFDFDKNDYYIHLDVMVPNDEKSFPRAVCNVYFGQDKLHGFSFGTSRINTIWHILDNMPEALPMFE